MRFKRNNKNGVWPVLKFILYIIAGFIAVKFIIFIIMVIMIFLDF